MIYKQSKQEKSVTNDFLAGVFEVNFYDMFESATAAKLVFSGSRAMNFLQTWAASRQKDSGLVGP